MSWWTAASSLIPIAAWDALGRDTTGILDRVGANNIVWSNSTEFYSPHYRHIKGKNIVGELTTTITLPSQYTLYMLTLPQQKLLMFSRSNTHPSALWNDDNNKIHIRNDDGNSTQISVATGYGGVRADALIKASSAATFMRDGTVISSTIPTSNCLTHVGRVTGWRTGNDDYTLDPDAEFYGAAIFSGAATLADVQAIDKALKAALYPPLRPNYRSVSMANGRRILCPLALNSGAPPIISRALPKATKNVHFGGDGYIANFVKERPKGAANDGTQDVPKHCRIDLHDYRSRVLVDSTWSDKNTGAYRFDHIDPDREYTVIAYDHEHVFVAVIADRVKPVRMT